MKLKKLTALAMTTAMCATAMFGCGSGSDNGSETTTASNGGATAENPVKAEILVWCPAEDQTSGWIQQECENFNKAHPEWDITFKYETCSEGDAGNNVVADPTLAGDIYFFASDQLPTLLSADAIQKLGGEIANYVKETNNDAIVQSVTRDDAIYGVPFTSNTWYMYYDKSVFSEEDVKSLDAMLEKGGVAFPITNSWYFASFYAAAGGTFCGPNGNDEAAGVVLGDKATAVTEYLVDLVANKNFVKDDQGSGMAGLKDGSVKAIFSGSWDYNNVKEILGDNIGVAQCPTMNIGGTECTMKSFAGAKSIGVNPHCENQEIAVSLAKYLASEEVQKSHYEMRNIIPCNKTLLESEAVKNDALAQAENSTIINTSIVQPANDSFNANYWTNAVNFATALLDGTVTKDNAAEKTVELENAWNGK